MKVLHFIISYSVFLIATAVTFGQSEMEFNENANNYRLLAEDYLENDNYTEAVDYFRKAIYEYSDNNHKNLANIYNNITRCYIGLKINNDALQNCLQALRLGKLHNIVPELIYSYNYLGIIKYNLNDNKDALENYLKALELSQSNDGDRALEANIINNIGATYDALGNKEKSIIYLKESLDLKLKMPDPDEAVRTANNLARVYFKQHKINLSLETYTQSLNLAKNYTKSEELGSVYLGFANVYFHTKEISKALNYAEDALKFSTIQNDVYLKKNVLKVISKCYAKTEQYEKAYDFHLLYSKLNDSITNERKTKQLVDLKTVYEKEKQDKKINLLKKENQLKDLEIQSSKRLLFFTLSALLLLSFFALIIYRNYKKYKTANKDLVRMNLDVVALDKQVNEIPTTKIEPEIKDKAQNSVLTDIQKHELINKLIPLFDDKKIFLEDDLTITKLAEKLNTNKSYVSAVINDEFHKNFNTFVNEYRVNEARLLLSKPENWNLKIESIGHSVGFKSKSAFYKAFKKFTGITPSFFLSTVKSNNL